MKVMADKGKKMLGQVGDFEVRLVKVFIAIVEHGGFSAAESALGISRSAISLHMSDLESRLGLRLCKRGRGGFALTSEGREVYRAGQNLLLALDRFRAEVNDLNLHLRGELSIGVINNLVTHPSMRITHALHSLKQAGPEVRIKISMTTPHEIELGVLNGHLHVGAVPLITPLSGLEYLPLYEEASQLYCHRSHPLFAREDEQIAEAEIRSCDAVMANYRLPAEGQNLQRKLRGSVSASDREGIAFLIHTGHFIGYLPEHYARQWVTAGTMRPLHPQRLGYATRLFLIIRKERRPNLVLDSFLQYFAKTA